MSNVNKNSKYTIKDFLTVKSAFSPSISPDGNMICYMSNSTGIVQAYIIEARSLESKPEQITFADDSVSFAKFSPTKNEIVFGKDAGGNEKYQFYIYSLDTKETRPLINKSEFRHNFGCFSVDGESIFYTSNERNGKDFDVYQVRLDTGAAGCLYKEGGDCYCSGLSKNGKKILMRNMHSNLDVDLILYDLESKTYEQITPQEGNTDENENKHEEIYYSSASWIEGDAGFYFTSNKGRDFFALAKYELASKKFEYVISPDWDVDSFTMSLDGKFLATTVNEDGYIRFNVYRSDDLSKPLELSIPKNITVNGFTFAADSSYIAIGACDSAHTNDIWTYSLSDNVYRQITKSEQGVPPEELAEPSLMRYASFDGLSIPAFVYKPEIIAGEASEDADKGIDGELEKPKKLPVIIQIHGGPTAQSSPALSMLTQYFVHQGYAVITPNVRGSSGYGTKYMALDDIDKRLDSVRDIAELHGHIKKEHPELDSEKVFLFGGSYGGFMVLAGLAFYPELWAGGIDVVGIANFVTFLQNTAPYRRANREAEYGSLENDREFLEKISPANHADKIVAPVLFLHGANDPRVPLSEAELIVYADEGHGIAKLKNKLDAYPRIADFIAGIVKANASK
jgi:dipeptidyl aminopeptidase/acylaminoacyl peptidase